MRRAIPKVRLFNEEPLADGVLLETGPDQAHYLKDVMRFGPGDEIAVFNGRDGEWCAAIDTVAKRRCVLRLGRRIRASRAGPDLWLLFAPVKRGPMDLIATKATELGAAALVPVTTARTVASRVNRDRMRLLAIEAAEQSGRCDVPDCHDAAPLDRVLDGWARGRKLLFCDEGGAGEPIVEALMEANGGGSDAKWAVLTGPEGGFADGERARLVGEPFVTAVDLGPRTLRAETAAIAALTCCQAVIGDWRQSAPGAKPARSAAGPA